MNRLAEKLISEKLVIFVIIINALALFFIGFIEDPRSIKAAGIGQADWLNFIYVLLDNIDYACVIYFIIEAAIKIKRFTWKGYFADPWNRFDFAIVVLSFPLLFKAFLPCGDFRVLLILRLGRLLRLFRILKFIPNRDHLVAGTCRALRASVGVLLALFLVIIILSIAGTYLFKDKAEEHFGNPLLSCYSIFKICTVEGWYEIPDKLAKEEESAVSATLYRLFFIISVISMGIIGLSLANAIFIDEMTIDNTKALEDKVDELQKEIRALRGEIRSVVDINSREAEN